MSRTSSGQAAPGRDRFLDLLRFIAVVRVVALHTATKPPVVYLPWIQWIFPGMAEVFFVSGVVTAASLRGQGAVRVIKNRIRRLMPPFYAYAVAAVAVMAVTDARSASPKATLTGQDVASFLLPVVHPRGSQTRVVLWGHLWFLTAFLWVIMASPLIFRLVRRWRAWSLLVPLAAFFTLVGIDKFGVVRVGADPYAIAMFGFFFQLGFVYRDGWLDRFSPRLLLGAGVALFALGWLVAEKIEPVWRKGPDPEMYESQSAHLLVGAAWMIAVIGLRGPISSWLARRRLRVLDLVTQRTYTLFVWGPAATAMGMAASRRVGGDEGNLALYLAVTVVMLVVLVACFGWIEDFASRRRPRLLPV